MGNQFLKILFVACILAGCSKPASLSSRVMQGAPVMSSESQKGMEQQTARQYLAYKHAIAVETEEMEVPTVFDAIQSTCKAASNEGCAILESHLKTGQYVSGELKFRAPAAIVQKLLKSIANQGLVTSQATTAEDLAGPIGDATKRIAMLNDYRTKLEALRGQASNNIDALIKVNKELAEIQNNLEEMSGKFAYLNQRVNTEILSVSITSKQNTLFWKKIYISLSNFGSNLAEGISSVITGVAFLLPWSLLLFLFIWVIRKIWFHRKKPEISDIQKDSK